MLPIFSIIYLNIRKFHLHRTQSDTYFGMHRVYNSALTSCVPIRKQWVSPICGQNFDEFIFFPKGKKKEKKTKKMFSLEFTLACTTLLMHPCETLNKLMFVTDMIDDALEVSWFCVRPYRIESYQAFVH